MFNNPKKTKLQKYRLYGDAFVKILEEDRKMATVADERLGITCFARKYEQNIRDVQKNLEKHGYVGRFGYKKKENSYCTVGDGYKTIYQKDAMLTKYECKDAPVFVLYNTPKLLVYIEHKDVQKLFESPTAFDISKLQLAPSVYSGEDRWEYVSVSIATKYQMPITVLADLIENADAVAEKLQKQNNSTNRDLLERQ